MITRKNGVETRPQPHPFNHHEHGRTAAVPDHPKVRFPSLDLTLLPEVRPLSRYLYYMLVVVVVVVVVVDVVVDSSQV